MPFPSYRSALAEIRRCDPNATGPDPQTGQVEARCPAHDDEIASLGLGKGDGGKALLFCQAGCDPLDIVKALGLGAEKRTRTISRKRGKTSPVPRAPVATLKPLPDQAAPTLFHKALMGNASRLAYLHESRGLRNETLKQYQIGWDGSRHTIPVEVDGVWVNLRRYKMNAGMSEKMRNVPGHGTAVLYPQTALADNADLPVLLCEGEWDALVANQESQGLLVAITVTGGATTVPKDLGALAGREVFVAYDCDKAGIAGAVKIQEALAEIAASVHILDLTRLGLTPDSKQDVTDLFLARDDAARALVAEMERLRDEPGDGPDEVLRAIQQMFLVADDSALDHLADGLTDDQIAALDPPRFVVDGWFSRGYFSVLYGAPGVMKTFAILDIVRHIRWGQAWHSHATERGAVLLYEGEGLQQVQARIAAWDERYPAADLAPGWSFQRFVDLTQPEGIAAIVRTVRGYEAQTGVPVNLIAIDPLVEFMTGDENGEGTQLASRGLRALAQYLNIAVLVGHHSNALGERARGTDHLKMRAGAHIRMERTAEGAVALVQEKQKNAAPHAIVLHPTSVGQSLVLETGWSVPAANYVAQKAGQASAERAHSKIEMSKVKQSVTISTARDLLVDAIRKDPGINQTNLIRATKGNGVGDDNLKAAIGMLADDGTIRIEATKTNGTEAKLHFLADSDQP